MKETSTAYENGKVVTIRSYEKSEAPQELNDLFDATFGKNDPTADTIAADTIDELENRVRKFVADLLGDKPLDISFDEILDAGYMGFDEDKQAIIVSVSRVLSAVSSRLIPAITVRVFENGTDLVAINTDECGNPCGYGVYKTEEE